MRSANFHSKGAATEGTESLQTERGIGLKLFVLNRFLETEKWGEGEGEREKEGGGERKREREKH